MHGVKTASLSQVFKLQGDEFQSGAGAAVAAASPGVEVTTGNVSAFVGFRQLTSRWLFQMEPRLERMLLFCSGLAQKPSAGG